MATLKDIAAITGLSTASISRVLNYDQTLKIAEEKRMLIFKTAEDLNYQIPKQRKLESGCILIIQAISKKFELGDPYFLALKMGAEKYCTENKINYESVYLEELDKENIKNYLGIVGIGIIDKDTISELEAENPNLIFVENNPLHGNYNSVNVDLAGVTKDIVEFYKTHNRKLVYIGNETTEVKFDIRYEAFKSWCTYYNLAHETVKCQLDVIESYLASTILLKNLSEKISVYCANDNVALGFIRAANELEVKIPEQAEVIGVNGISATEFSSPKLSTVVLPAEYMGGYAVRMLLEYLHDTESICINHVISTKIVERESTISSS